MTTNLTQHDFFPSPIYIVDKPEFLPAVSVVADKYLTDVKAVKDTTNPLYPVQTDGFFHEPVLADFTQFIAQTAWNILRDQGHDMTNLGTYFREMWCQEHNQYQGHDEHIHHYGDQISGFYFLECPENSSQVAIHDPRPGKKQINLPENDPAVVTLASTSAILIPTAGRMYFINSWLPHSILRNPSTSVSKLVHFNLTVGPLPVEKKPDSPIIV
jgi:uncharacterized protein (TIGR02466 family)